MRILIATCATALSIYLCNDNRLIAAEASGVSDGEGFYSDNFANISDVDSTLNRPPGDIVGLRVSDAFTQQWRGYARYYTNVIFLRVETGSDTIPEDVLQNCMFFGKLKYLILLAPKARNIPDTISELTNVAHLESLSIAARKVTNINSAIYSIVSLKVLKLNLGNVSFPAGIAGMTNLRNLDFMATKIHYLPPDIANSGVRELGFMRLAGVAKELPVLPPNLEDFAAAQCGLEVVPEAWLHHKKLSVLSLNGNRITTMPNDLTGLPALKALFIEDNAITNVPALRVPENLGLKIRLFGNPIHEVAAENETLITNGILELDINGLREKP